MRNIDDAEDLTQDVFLHLHKNIHQFRGESKFSTWLHRITVNYALMKLRSGKVAWIRNTASLDEMYENPECVNALQRALTCRDSVLESTIARTVLQEALKDMPLGYRVAIELHCIQGMNHEEIALVLDTSAGNSKSQVHKAKAWLADKIGAAHVGTSSEEDVDTMLSDLEQYL